MKINMTTQLASKYLNVDELLTQDFHLESPVDNLDLSTLLILNTYCLVVINGHVNLSLSVLPDQLFKMTADGKCSLYVAPHQKINQPLHILNIHKNTERPSLQQLTFFIHLDSYAELAIFEEHMSIDGGTYLNHIAIEIILDKNAYLNYYKLQRDSMRAYHLATTTVSQQENSVLHYFLMSNGSKMNRDDLLIAHRECGSFAELNGVFRACDDQQVMQHTRADHFGSGCTTKQHYRGLASDHAKCVFDGQMIVHPGAAKNSVHQSNHNLLLSNTAEIDSQPTLEIYADDVSASHGATVGQLDIDALFYCQSRGIPLKEAKRLLVTGFVNALFDELPSNAITDYMKKIISENL